MKIHALSLLFLLPLAAQSAPVDPTDDAPDGADETSADGAAAEPTWEGTASQGLQRIALVSQEQDGLAEALDVAAALLAREGDEALGDALRAEVYFARGVARHRNDRWSSAEADFLAARGPAGPGELRRDAAYNAGCMRLERAEAAYQRLPEVSGAAAPGGLPVPLPAVPGAAPPGGGDDDGAQLEEARREYEAARELFVERLRLDWRDEDTRANLEWIQRRLRELDEIEEEREQQEEPPPQDQQPQDGEDEESEQGDDGESESEESQDESEDSAEPDEPGEQDEPEDPEQPEESEEPSEPEELEQPEESQPEETEASEPEAPEESPAPQNVEPLELSPEQAQRLLDALSDIEERGEELQAMLREFERVPVEKDW